MLKKLEKLTDDEMELIINKFINEKVLIQTATNKMHLLCIMNNTIDLETLTYEELLYLQDRLIAAKRFETLFNASLLIDGFNVNKILKAVILTIDECETTYEKHKLINTLGAWVVGAIEIDIIYEIDYDLISKIFDVLTRSPMYDNMFLVEGAIYKKFGMDLSEFLEHIMFVSSVNEL